jgi:peptidoglycan/LPS O-acetylase OafA/YrhL
VLRLKEKNTVVLFAVTFALSALTYRIIEAPALRLKTRSPRPRVARAPVPLQQP